MNCASEPSFPNKKTGYINCEPYHRQTSTWCNKVQSCSSHDIKNNMNCTVFTEPSCSNIKPAIRLYQLNSIKDKQQLGGYKMKVQSFQPVILKTIFNLKTEPLASQTTTGICVNPISRNVSFQYGPTCDFVLNGQWFVVGVLTTSVQFQCTIKTNESNNWK